MKNCIRIFVLLLCFSASPSVTYAQTSPKVSAAFSQSSINPSETLIYTVEILSLKAAQAFVFEFPKPAFFGLDTINQSSDQESYKADGQLWSKQSYHFFVNLSEDVNEAGVHSFEFSILTSKNEIVETLNVPAITLNVTSDRVILKFITSILLLLTVLIFFSVLYLKKKKNKASQGASHRSFEEDCVARLDILEFKGESQYQNELKTLFDVLASFVQKRYNVDLKNPSKFDSIQLDKENQNFENERKKIKEFAHEITELRYAASDEKSYEAKRLSARISSYIESKKIIAVKIQ